MFMFRLHPHTRIKQDFSRVILRRIIKECPDSPPAEVRSFSGLFKQMCVREDTSPHTETGKQLLNAEGTLEFRQNRMHFLDEFQGKCLSCDQRNIQPNELILFLWGVAWHLQWVPGHSPQKQLTSHHTLVIH